MRIGGLLKSLRLAKSLGRGLGGYREISRFAPTLPNRTLFHTFPIQNLYGILKTGALHPPEALLERGIIGRLEEVMAPELAMAARDFRTKSIVAATDDYRRLMQVAAEKAESVFFMPGRPAFMYTGFVPKKARPTIERIFESSGRRIPVHWVGQTPRGSAGDYWLRSISAPRRMFMETKYEQLKVMNYLKSPTAWTGQGVREETYKKVNLELFNQELSGRPRMSYEELKESLIIPGIKNLRETENIVRGAKTSIAPFADEVSQTSRINLPAFNPARQSILGRLRNFLTGSPTTTTEPFYNISSSVSTTNTSYNLEALDEHIAKVLLRE